MYFKILTFEVLGNIIETNWNLSLNIWIADIFEKLKF